MVRCIFQEKIYTTKASGFFYRKGLYLLASRMRRVSPFAQKRVFINFSLRFEDHLDVTRA
jgi:hypothetical protein